MKRYLESVGKPDGSIQFKRKILSEIKFYRRRQIASDPRRES